MTIIAMTDHHPWLTIIYVWVIHMWWSHRFMAKLKFGEARLRTRVSRRVVGNPTSCNLLSLKSKLPFIQNQAKKNFLAWYCVRFAWYSHCNSKCSESPLVFDIACGDSQEQLLATKQLQRGVRIAIGIAMMGVTQNEVKAPHHPDRICLSQKVRIVRGISLHQLLTTDILEYWLSLTTFWPVEKYKVEINR